MTTKKCSKCKESKPLVQFNKQKGAPDGHRGVCKACHRTYMKQRNNPRKKTGAKTCSMCKMKKDVSLFSSDKGRSDGLQSNCKMCAKLLRQKYTNTNATEKECNICKQTKSLNDFHKNASGRYGRHNDCKICRSQARKKIKYDKPTSGKSTCSKCGVKKDVSQFHADRSLKTGLQSQCYECRLGIMRKWGSGLNGYITKLFNTLRCNAKRRSKILDIEITTTDIHKLYQKQHGLCALTGLPMTHKAYTRKGNQHIIHKMNLSVDRIDSDKGYTKDNVQLVGAIINRMKSDLYNKEFISLCRSVVDYHNFKQDPTNIEVPTSDKDFSLHIKKLKVLGSI